MTEPLAPPPLWLRAGRALARRLPAGRFRAFGLLTRRGARPFLDRLAPEVGGWAYRCDLRHLIAREICLTGRYSPPETALVLDSLAPGGTFVDVGGNLGYFALIAAGRVSPAGRVVAVEPDPRMAAALRENVALNGLSQVEVMEAAAGEHAGRVELAGYAEDGGNWGVSTLVPASAAPAHPFPVRCAPLDDLLDEAGVDAVDLVKIDVEGAEAAVLRGMRAGLRRHRYRRVLVELHPWAIADFRTVLSRLADELAGAGYRGWLLADSPAESRRQYYGAPLRPALVPLRPREVTTAWPHVLWTLPEAGPR